MSGAAAPAPLAFDAGDGVRLHVERGGRGPTLLLLHGFTGSVESWAPLRAALSAMTTVAVDLPGHGHSSTPADPARLALPRLADDLARLLDALGVGRAAVLGYSMGGRAALHLARRHPDRVAALVLESASPGIADAAARAARVAADRTLADGIERDGIAAFVDRWERLPLWVSQHALDARTRATLRAQRLRHDPRGLAASLRGAGAGAEPPLHRALPSLGMPALLVAGALDERYAAIGRETAARMPRARLAVVADAGHAVHLERPDAFATLVDGFLAGVPRAGAGWA